MAATQPRVTVPLSLGLPSSHAGDYIDPDVDPESVVADLEGVLAHLEEIKSACETYKVSWHCAWGQAKRTRQALRMGASKVQKADIMHGCIQNMQGWHQAWVNLKDKIT